MLQLAVIYGRDAGKCHNFQQSVIHIGTDPGNDFQLTDTDISEYHGEFTCNHEAGHYAYRDLQSTHGSRIQSSSLNVLLFSHQMPQSIALAGEIMLSVGQSVIRCKYIRNHNIIQEVTSPRKFQTLSLHSLPPTKDTGLLTFLLDTSTALTARTTHQTVLSHISRVLLMRIPHASHVTIWKLDSIRNDFTCVHERTTGDNLTQPIVSDPEFFDALHGHTASLYAKSNGEPGNAIVAPLTTMSREIGVIVVDTEDAVGMSENDLECVARLASIASHAVERTYYNSDISSVFDGFIRAIIAVMDARDPATAGHSIRVAKYVLFLAQAIHTSSIPAFQLITFSQNHLDELRFAALLHDIGKVVLKREILLKSAKLTDNDLHHLLERLDLFAAWFQTQSPEALADKYRPPQQFDHYKEIVTRVVQADVKPSAEDLVYLQEMTRTFIPACPGIPLLKPNEYESLLIPFGTLNAEERAEIQKHALISWQYLSQIAWPQRWANVPLFVLQHHEKLNGTGYPYGISGEQILLQSRMITVCDIFDALTGGDRSYKTRHSFGDAAQILQRDAQNGALDADVVNIFIRQVIPQICQPDDMTNSLTGISAITR